MQIREQLWLRTFMGPVLKAFATLLGLHIYKGLSTKWSQIY